MLNKAPNCEVVMVSGGITANSP